MTAKKWCAYCNVDLVWSDHERAYAHEDSESIGCASCPECGGEMRGGGCINEECGYPRPLTIAEAAS